MGALLKKIKEVKFENPVLKLPPRQARLVKLTSDWNDPAPDDWLAERMLGRTPNGSGWPQKTLGAREGIAFSKIALLFGHPVHKVSRCLACKATSTLVLNRGTKVKPLNTSRYLTFFLKKKNLCLKLKSFVKNPRSTERLVTLYVYLLGRVGTTFPSMTRAPRNEQVFFIES